MQHPDDLIEKSYFSIGEVASLIGVAPSVLRFWEKEFPDLKPAKNDKGTRKFNREDVALIKQIYQLLKVEGHTIEGARERLKMRLTQEGSFQVVDKLIAIRDALKELREAL